MLEIRLKKTIEGALLRAKEGGLLALQNMPDFTIERPKFEGHGDLATNVAMMLSKPEKKAPRDIAQIIVSQIQDDILESIEIAGPGFINFTLKTSVYIEELKELFKGFKIDIPKIIGTKKKKYQVEFVSANPTGPLHIGHGRGAVFGDTLANILKAAGHYVEKEYYVNDAGNQMNTLGKSVYLRIKERSGEKIEFPEDCYQGEYISDIAQELIDTKKAQGYMDMGEDKAIYELGQHAANLILKEIKIDLEDCGIVHDHYFHEKTL
ncbi:arginine--tRNA ligase, partial [bacterium]|nr:arginine--tRNA ligase [bacterium]